MGVFSELTWAEPLLQMVWNKISHQSQGEEDDIHHSDCGG
jgi:hypothetical protein